LKKWKKKSMPIIQNQNNSNSNFISSGQRLTAVRVKDIILDISHPKAIEFGGYDSIGTIFYTMLKNNTPLEDVNTANIARPIFSNIKHYPLKEEIVLIVSAEDKKIYSSEGTATAYYFPPLNIWNHPHHNALPSITSLKNDAINRDYQTTENGTVIRRAEDERTDINLGKYFKELLNIKTLVSYEGDYILEGRFGNSIRLGSTNIGVNIPDEINNTWSTSGRIGDPITIIRNGQSSELDSKGWVPTIEDLNDDATSIYLTSNQKLSDFRVASTNFQSYQAELELPEDLDTILSDPKLNIVVQTDPPPIDTPPLPVVEDPVIESPSPIVEEETSTPFDVFIENNENVAVSEIEDRTENQQITPGSNLALGTSYLETESTGPVDVQQKIGIFFTLSNLIYSDTAKEQNINNLPGIDKDIEKSKIINNLKNVTENLIDNIYLQYPTMYVSSGYRCKELNTEIGGADDSQHMYGEAIDIQVPGVNASEVFNWIINNLSTYDQIIWEFPEKGEGSWIHISYSTTFNRKETLLATNSSLLRTAYSGDSTYTSINFADQSKVPV